jgi:hypothetical protein
MRMVIIIPFISPLNKGAVSEADWGIYFNFSLKNPPIGFAAFPPC